MSAWTHLSIAAMSLAAVALGVRDEQRQNATKAQVVRSDGHAIIVRDPPSTDSANATPHEKHVLHIESKETDKLTDEEWYLKKLARKQKAAKLLIKMGAAFNRPHGYWVIGTKLFSRDDGVVAKIADEIFSPGNQWMIRETYQFPANFGIVAKYPWRSAWPWMDNTGNFIHRSFEQSELQKLGPFPELDNNHFWSTYGIPQLKQSSPCNCKWTSTCKFYYEVELLEDVSEPQIGWATTDMQPTLSTQEHSFKGVGDDKSGWAADGARNMFFLAGTVETGTLSAMWRKGDVVGLAVDMLAGTMKWSLNGFWHHAPEKQFELNDRELFPCLSMWGDFKMLIAHKDWKFSPPENDYVPWTDASTFAGHEPLPSDIEMDVKADNQVLVTGKDASKLGIAGDYKLSWNGVGLGEAYYKHDPAKGKSETTFLYHINSQ